MTDNLPELTIDGLAGYGLAVLIEDLGDNLANINPDDPADMDRAEVLAERLNNAGAVKHALEDHTPIPVDYVAAITPAIDAALETYRRLRAEIRPAQTDPAIIDGIGRSAVFGLLNADRDVIADHFAGQDRFLLGRITGLAHLRDLVESAAA